VAKAEVRIVNTGTNTTTILSTNETGYYQAALLLPGSYQVRVESRGFKTYLRDGISLSVSSHLEIDVTLEVEPDGTRKGNVGDKNRNRKTWRANLGGVIAAGPVSYLSNGRQQITIAAGSALFTFGIEE
jgi:hypothetical protein